MIEKEKWLSDKLGVITSTRSAAVMGGKKARTTLIAQLISEIANPEVKETYHSEEMERGIEEEANARSYYELIHNVDVYGDGSFIRSDLHHRLGTTPDGLVNNDGGIEIKVLSPHNHVRVTISGEVDKKHEHQIYWHLFVTGRQWWDYVGYCPEMPDSLRFYTKRYCYDPTIINEYRTEAESIIDQLDTLLSQFDINIL